MLDFILRLLIADRLYPLQMWLFIKLVRIIWELPFDFRYPNLCLFLSFKQLQCQLKGRRGFYSGFHSNKKYIKSLAWFRVWNTRWGVCISYYIGKIISYVFSFLFYLDNVIDLCSFWMLDLCIFFMCLLSLTVMINNYMEIN